MRQGYTYGDRLLRPAMVGVSDPAPGAGAAVADAVEDATGGSERHTHDQQNQTQEQDGQRTTAPQTKPQPDRIKHQAPSKARNVARQRGWDGTENRPGEAGPDVEPHEARTDSSVPAHPAAPRTTMHPTNKQNRINKRARDGTELNQGKRVDGADNRPQASGPAF